MSSEATRAAGRSRAGWLPRSRMAGAARSFWRGDWLVRGPATATAVRKRLAARSGSGLGLLYLALAGVVAAAAMVVVRHREDDLTTTLGIEIATEALGILVTVAVVHRLLERQEGTRRLRGSAGAIRGSGRALQASCDAWTDLIKGSLPGLPDPAPRSLPELLTPRWTAALLDCDVDASVSAGREGGPRRAFALLRAARADLHRVLTDHRAILDPAYVEVLDDVAHDPFPGIVDELVTEPANDPRQWLVRLQTTRTLRTRYFERLLAAVALHNALARRLGALRSGTGVAQTDMLGIELNPDWELRVTTELNPRWWRTDPRPGSFRRAAPADGRGRASGA